MREALLGPDEGHPVIHVNEKGKAPFVIICEHAGRIIPKSLGNLGLTEAELTRHIAWDIGAEGLSRKLSAALDAPLVLQRYSRLVYDCNRPPEHAGAMAEVSETTPIPGNQGLSAAERQLRADALYYPFHQAVRAVMDRKIADDPQVMLVTIHSFTPIFKGEARAVELGLLHDADARVAQLLLQLTREQSPQTDVRINEPYRPQDGVAHTVNLHGDGRGIASIMLEVRNDLISEAEGQAAWAEQLADRLRQAQKMLAANSL